MQKKNDHKMLKKMVDLSANKDKSHTLTLPEALQKAEAAFAGGNLLGAEFILRRAIEAAPKLSSIYIMLADVLDRSGDRGGAKHTAQQAMKLEPANIKNILFLIALYDRLMDTEQTQLLLKKALSIAPKNPEVLAAYGDQLLRNGQMELATKIFRDCITLNPENGKFYYLLSVADGRQLKSGDIENIDKIIATASQDSQGKTLGMFAAAKKYALEKDYEQEFFYLNQANQALRATYNWTWQQELEKWRRIKAVYTPEFAKSIQSAQNSQFTPLILATMPRSGGTLVEQILSTNRGVSTSGESNLFLGPLMKTARILFGTYQAHQVITKDNSQEFILNYQNEVNDLVKNMQLDNAFISEKSIKNVFNIGIIAAAYPNARFVHLSRNPLDIALSCYQNYFSSSLEYKGSLFDTVMVCQIFDEAIAHWKKIFPDRILTINYEQLVSEPEIQTKKLLDFCGLEWSEECFDLNNAQGTIRTASVTQARNKISNNSINRWKIYEAFLQPALTALATPLPN